MAKLDMFVLLMQGIVVIVFGATVLISCVFTFFIDDYLRFEERFIDIDALSKSLINPINRNIRALYEWCVFNHAAIGLILIFSSLWVLVSLFNAVSGI